jgi:UDP-galactopyranose mutase
VEECLIGAIEARHGDWRRPLDERRSSNGTAACHAHSNGAPLRDCCADGIMEADLPRAPAADGAEPRDFEEFIYRVWGAGIAKHFAIPYNRKLWTVPLTEMETSWLQGRVPLPDLPSIVRGALHPSPRPMGPNARFGYPKRGGFQALMDGFLPHLRGEVRLGSEVSSISPAQRTVTLRDGAEIHYAALVSTLPLPELIRRIEPEPPPSMRRAATGLQHVSCRCVNIGVGRPDLTEKHWTYYPEDTVFHRIFFQGNASPECNPPGGFGLTCEITYSPSKPLPCEGDDLIRLCIEDCRRVGIFTDADPVLTANQVDIPYAYVVYDHGRTERVQLIRTWLSDYGIFLAGRYSEWEYYNSDHAFLAGKNAADAVEAMLAGGSTVERPAQRPTRRNKTRSASV